MAIYHLSMKTVARSKGQSATASAAYRAAEKIEDKRTGEIFDYTKKKGVIETALILPKNAQKMNRSELWNSAEAAENRKNSTIGREYEIALPAELTAAERSSLTKEFASWIVETYGVAADIAIHEPNRKGDEKNYHAHILTTTRTIGREGLGEKTRQLDDRKTGEVEKIREKWEQLCNHELSIKGEKEISRATLKAQGVDRQPQIHVGAAATAMERSGKTSLRYRRNQAIKDLPAYKAQLAELQKALAPAAEISPATARTPENTPNLKSAGELSAKEAEALLRASTAQIEKKPLEDFNSRRAAEMKVLEKREKSSFGAYSAFGENRPEKKRLEFRSTFEEREREWSKERNRLWEQNRDDKSAIKRHNENTEDGKNKINREARQLAEKNHPKAVAAIKLEEENKKKEWQRQREEKRQRSKSHGLGR